MSLSDCWCGRPPHYTGAHMVDTADPRWPLGQPACLCGGTVRTGCHLNATPVKA